MSIFHFFQYLNVLSIRINNRGSWFMPLIFAFFSAQLINRFYFFIFDDIQRSFHPNLLSGLSFHNSILDLIDHLSIYLGSDILLLLFL